MKPPVARTIGSAEIENPPVRPPRAFAPERASAASETVETLIEAGPDPETLAPRGLGGIGLLAKVMLTAANILIALGIGVVADILIRALFDRSPWLGWLGVAVVVVFVVAIVALGIRQWLALRRLRVIATLRRKAESVLISDDRHDGKDVLHQLHVLYDRRPDLARARELLDRDSPQLLDGADIVRLAERQLMAPLDTHAKALIAASARRVALVTAVSPRALVDIAFAAWESILLAGAVARLYGARPGMFGSMRLAGSVLSHLAITGGLALTDGAIEQLVGHGLAARISSRLGEGLVNGLMTVRVGIATIRVVRPLPFDTQRTPQVRDFIAELANVAAKPPTPSA